MTTIETKAISELNLPVVTVCPPKGTFTNLNYDLVTINNTLMGEDQIKSLKTFIHKAIIDQEFEAVSEEDKSYMIKGKYESWFKGITQFTLPETKTKTTFYLWTTASVGEAETPNFGADYSKKSFPLKLSYILLIFPPKNITSTKDKLFNLEIQVNTKKYEGEGSEWIEISPSGLPTEMIKLSGPVVKNKTYPVIMRTRKNTRQMLIRYERRFTEKDLLDWSEKINTGFRAKWYYTDTEGNNLDIEADDLHSVPMNALFVQFVQIYNVLLSKGHTKDKLVAMIKNEKFILTENYGSAVMGKCFEGVLNDHEVEKMLENIALTNEVSEEEKNTTNIRSRTLKPSPACHIHLCNLKFIFFICKVLR